MEWIESIFLVLAYVAVIGFLISGLDDLFFDSQFLVYLFRSRKKPHITLNDLRLAPEQRIALFVPAWQEGGVVNRMAEFASRIVLYEQYDIFIGVYPNDPETNHCVDAVCAANPRIRKVLVPHDGPTSKADCLNWIYKAMRLNEIPGTREYKILAIHDAEDVLHPLVLKVYNYFIPNTCDMGQVPVFALELPVWKHWTGNSYIDDFAELHTKDLFIRQSIGGIVPSAGVGTAFSREALDKLAADNQGDPFLVGNLTEDYEVGIRVRRAGFRAAVLSVPVDRIVRRKRRDGSLGPPRVITEVVAIRESFPKTFATAVRQRSRWILGISYQTWEQTGWSGSLPMRYTLLRDRRAPLTHVINMTGYVVLAYALGQWLFRQSTWGEHLYLEPLFRADSWLWRIALIDSWLLLYRGAQKFISVQSIYNLKQALFSLPRLVVGNFINFTSTVRATRMYLAHRLFNRPIVWLKTKHIFPEEAELGEFEKSVEDLLVEEGLVTHEQIVRALEVEKAGSAPLCLLRMGLLDEQHFTEVWAKHSRLPVRLIQPQEIPSGPLRRFPEAESLQWEALPVEQTENQLLMAFREPPSRAQLDQLSLQLGYRVQPLLARPSNIAFARARAYPRLVLPPSRLDLQIERFRHATGLDAKVFLQALSDRYPSRQSLPEVLAGQALLSEAEARRLWAATLGCPPLDIREFTPNQELYLKVGPPFWWLHRLLPLTKVSVAIGGPAHPLLLEWLAARMGTQPNLVAELPGKLELAARNRGVELDPDQILLDWLVTKGWLPREKAPDLRSLRQLIADPLPRWLALQKLVTPEHLHQAFLDLCSLPPAGPWATEEVRRLRPVLPPGLAEESGCWVLEETQGALRLGLSQLPLPHTLREIHDRLAGYPFLFQALSHEQALALRALAATP